MADKVIQEFDDTMTALEFERALTKASQRIVDHLTTKPESKPSIDVDTRDNWRLPDNDTYEGELIEREFRNVHGGEPE